MWQPGDRLSHRFNQALGPGRVITVEDRRVVVEFPQSGQTLGFVASTDALVPIELTPGGKARVEATGEIVTIESRLADGRIQLSDDRELDAADLWPLPAEQSPIELLRQGSVDSWEDMANRIDALRLDELRQARGLGSFLGGRIRLYPHQLYAAERATTDEPVRWLLADGVGLGKTVEACLIMNRLIHTSRAERTLVVAPESLTVQWLGELWRKHHQVFVLLDKERIEQVALDQGDAANPFEVHRRAIIALETLVEDRRLVELAVEAGVDLLVVDEAHHLRRPEGHPGNLAYRAIAPIAALNRNVLLLTATPLEDDAIGFMRLLQLLRPSELPEGTPLLDRLDQRQPLPACTSATRAADIGGWPPRVPSPVELSAEQYQPIAALERLTRALEASNEVARAKKARLVCRALASSAALRASWKGHGAEIDAELRAAEENDPRVDWLARQARACRDEGEKTLVFVAHRETLETARSAIEHTSHVRVAIFHEDLSTTRRDLEVAQLRLEDGPSMMITTECGGEGRNFEHCDRLVLLDLPWHPAVVEQRIGRLDRIGRSRPTEIVYFKPPSGLGAEVVRLYEEMGLFRESVGSIGHELNQIAREIARVAADSEATAQADSGDEGSPFENALDRARAAMTRIQEAAFHELHREPYTESMSDEILERVPPELERLTAEVVLRAAARFGFEVEQQQGNATWYIELGTESLVDRLPGVPPGTRFLGTFDREEAVEREGIDFFASGHPLVEGVLHELEEGSRGRAAFIQVPGDTDLFGLLAVYRNEENGGCEIIAVDAEGEARPEIAAHLSRPGLTSEPVDSRLWTGVPGWSKAVRRIAKALPAERSPRAVAAFRIRKV